MKKCILSLFSLAIVTLTLRAETTVQNAKADPLPPRNHVLTSAQIEADLALVEESYKRLHPGYSRYTSQSVLDRYWQDVKKRAEQQSGMRVGDFYKAIQLGLAKIRCDHTKAELPESMKEARKRLPAYLPVRWRFIQGRGFVEFAKEGSGLQTGDEILSIDGISLDTLRAKYSPYISVDGFTDHVKDTELAFSSEFMGGAIEHFEALNPKVSATARLKIRRMEQQIDVDVDKLNFTQWRGLQKQYAPFRRNFVDQVSWQPLGENGALLNVGTFVNYRKPVDPDSIYGPIVEAINLQKRNKLIIDLRENGGGSTGASERLLAHLTPRPEYLQREAHVADWRLDGLTSYLSTWEQSALSPQPEWFEALPEGGWRIKSSVITQRPTMPPARHVFTGEVVVLTSHTNASGVTSLIAKLKDMGRITVIGEDTGGSSTGPTANVLFFLTLPESGIVARLPAQKVVNNVTSGIEGKGIEADVKVELTIADWKSGNDKVLAAARQHLGI